MLVTHMAPLQMQADQRTLAEGLSTSQCLTSIRLYLLFLSPWRVAPKSLNTALSPEGLEAGPPGSREKNPAPPGLLVSGASG